MIHSHPGHKDESGSTTTGQDSRTGASLGGQGSHFGNETGTGTTGGVGSQAAGHVPGEFPSDVPQSGYPTAGTSQGLGDNNPVQGGTYDRSLNPEAVHSGAGASREPQFASGQTGGLTSTSATTTSGPHSSNLANKADPRVDSDNSQIAGGTGLTGGNVSSGYGASGVPQSSTTGANLGSGQTGSSLTDRSYPIGSGPTSSTTAGPHSSNLANKADPRVDSDLDGSGAGHTGGTAAIGTTTTARSFPLGIPSTTGGTSTNTGYGGSTTSGPHSSNVANKADPRVDSDNSRLGGSGGGSGLTGTSTETGYGGSTTSGPHSSNVANKADPRVDSDSSRIGGAGLTGSSAGTGYGNTSSTGAYGSSATGSGHDDARHAAVAATTGGILGSAASRGGHTGSGVSSTFLTTVSTSNPVLATSNGDSEST